jgi:uncharacterized protein YndB with AHSA1/START domain
MNWTQRRRRKARRRLYLRCLGGLVGLLVCGFLVGLTIGPEQIVSRQLRLARPPEAIWRVLLDLDGMPMWRSDLVALERLPDQAGGPAWREIGPSGVRVIALTVAEPPHRLVLRRTEAGVPALPARTFELTSTEGGTLLTLTERTLVRNPLRRAFNRLHPPRGGIARLLRDLDARLRGGRREVVARPG